MMVRKLYFVALVIVAFLTTACGSKSNIEELVPADAAWVVRIDTKSVLTKATLMNDNGVVALNEQTKEAIAGCEGKFRRIVETMPTSGLDFAGDWYFFNSSAVFVTEALLPVADYGAVERWIAVLTSGGGMQNNDGYRYVYDDRMLYVLYDNILYMGLTVKQDEQKALSAALEIFKSQGNASIYENEEAKEALSAKADMTLYADVKALGNLASRWKNQRVMGLSPIPLASEIGIKSVNAAFNFDSSLDITADIIAGDGSVYSTLCSQLLAESDEKFLEIIPEDMEKVVMFSLNGKNLLKIEKIKQLIGLKSTMPIIRDLDLKKIISTINGPVAVGVSADANFINEYNYVVAISTDDRQVILDEISRVATKYGQRPSPNAAGETTYSYFNQRVTVGMHGSNYVYLKILNAPVSDSGMSGNSDLASLMSRSKIGGYWSVEAGIKECEFLLGGLSGSKFLAQFKNVSSGTDSPTVDDTQVPENILPSLIAILCQPEEQRGFESYDLDEEYGSFEPIDEMVEF